MPDGRCSDGLLMTVLCSSSETEAAGAAHPPAARGRPDWLPGLAAARKQEAASHDAVIVAGGRSDVESQRAELLAAVLGNLLRPPRWQPHPVDREAWHQAVERRGRLILDHVGQRAGRTGQRHVDGHAAVALHMDLVDEAEVHDVHAQFRVDDVSQRLEHILDLRVRGRLQLDVCSRLCGGFLAHAHSPIVGSSARLPVSARAVASFQAIQQSNAHLMRAGYFDTPSKATASPRTSSSGSAAPRDCIRARNSSLTAIASATVFPMIRSAMTDVLAWLIEQPSVSWEMSAITGSPP